MKVILVNGSPHEKGCTYTALEEVVTTLNQDGVETEIFQLGTQALSGCIACGKCKENGRCVFDDKVNEFLDKARYFDGFVFGTPVHYAAIAGSFKCFMDRVFYAGNRDKEEIFYLKPAAGIISARRAGTTAAFDQVNKYFTISQMPVVSSRYWNMVHGHTPDDVRKDQEGLQIMRILGRNMAFFLKCREAGLQAGLSLPEKEKTLITNFID